jgi:hypothetical protein
MKTHKNAQKIYLSLLFYAIIYPSVIYKIAKETFIYTS